MESGYRRGWHGGVWHGGTPRDRGSSVPPQSMPWGEMPCWGGGPNVPMPWGVSPPNAPQNGMQWGGMACAGGPPSVPSHGTLSHGMPLGEGLPHAPPNGMAWGGMAWGASPAHGTPPHGTGRRCHPTLLNRSPKAPERRHGSESRV